MVWCHDTPGAFERLIESSRLSPVLKRTGPSKQFLNHDGTEVGARNVSQITRTKLPSESPVPEHRDVDARIKQETSCHRSCHTSGKSGAFPATWSNPSSTSLRRVT